MTIELLRQVETKTLTGYEIRSYWAGIDTEQLPAPLRQRTPSGLECGLEPRHFWFTFAGERYHALSYILTWVTQGIINENAEVAPQAQPRGPA